MEIFDFSNNYIELIDVPKLRDKSIWKKYFSQLNDIIRQNEIVFINKATSSFEARKVKQVNKEYQKILNAEQVKLSKAEEDYFRLFNESYRNHRQMKNENIQNWLPYIERVDYSEFGMLGLHTVSIIMMDNVAIVVEKKLNSDYKLMNKISKTQLLDTLISLDLGYWAKEYVSKFALVCDGITWELKFNFIKGKKSKKLKFYGDNCFPHNFDEFEQLFLKRD